MGQGIQSLETARSIAHTINQLIELNRSQNYDGRTTAQTSDRHFLRSR